MTDVTNALDAVGALIAERTKYEGWISALATKTDVSAHVLDKVRADYTSRLRAVLQGFTAHTPSLDAALKELQSRDGALAAQEKSCRDEHAEGELRHMVGEYDAEQWDSIRIGHEALLNRLGGERQGIAGELASVQRSLGAAADAAARARSLVETSDASGAARADAFTPGVAVAPHEPVVAALPMIAMPEPIASAPAAVTPPHAAPMPEPAERRAATDDDLGFLRTAQRAPTPRESGLAGEAASVATATKSPETPMLRIVPNAPGTVDAAKTLRCAECGTLNYATEWYCERCGGELAVL